MMVFSVDPTGDKVNGLQYFHRGCYGRTPSQIRFSGDDGTVATGEAEEELDREARFDEMSRLLVASVWRRVRSIPEIAFIE